MITKYNSRYDELFVKANETLNLADDQKIYTLEQYFNQLRNLVYGSDGNLENPNYEFLKIPLDEPHFEVDLNTRNIKVPEEFRQNGISVTGDQMAELLFFEVDRFFDATDLMNTKIYILWSNAFDNRINKTEAFDPQAFSIKETEYNEKIIFGWPISDDITAAAGKIKIAIQFEIMQDDKVTYNLSTLPKEVSVNAGLQFNGKTTDASIFKQYLANHVVNSNISTNTDEAVPPVLQYWGYMSNDTFNSSTTEILENLAEDACLYAYATKDNQGTIKYSWNNSAYAVPTQETGIFVPVGTNPNIANATYWIKTSNGEYKQAKNTDSGERYILCSKLGYDSLEAGDNYITKTQNQLTASIITDGEDTLTWTIAGPTKPDDISMENKMLDGEVELTAEFTITAGDVPTYTWYKDGNEIDNENKQTLIVTEEGKYKVTVKTTRNKASSEEATSNTFYVVTAIQDLKLNIINDNGTLSVAFDRELSSFEHPAYLWTIDGLQASSYDTIEVGPNGHYVVYVTITKDGLPSGLEAKFNTYIDIQN